MDRGPGGEEGIFAMGGSPYLQASFAVLYIAMKTQVFPSFGTYVKIGTIQRRLAWPLRKDDTMNTENGPNFFVHFIVRHVLVI